jgi:isopentenyl-diphosphate Delta-isomerase
VNQPHPHRSEETLILVDENDNQIGTGEKMEVHRRGHLHRCFSIFVLNSGGEVLLQRRSASKYHSGGLWTNTCCGHPRDGEGTAEAAHRRLREEMGFDCDLEEVLSFIYRQAALKDGLIEHELDHTFTGRYDGAVAPNPEEVDGCRWVAVADLRRDMDQRPEQYTVWSRIALSKLTELWSLPSSPRSASTTSRS